MQILLQLAVQQVSLELPDPHPIPFISPDFGVIDDSVGPPHRPSSLLLGRSGLCPAALLKVATYLLFFQVLALAGIHAFIAVGGYGTLKSGDLVQEYSMLLVVVYHAVLYLQETLVVRDRNPILPVILDQSQQHSHMARYLFRFNSLFVPLEHETRS